MTININNLKGSSRSYNNQYSRYAAKEKSLTPNQQKFVDILKNAGEDGITNYELQRLMNFKHPSQINTAMGLCKNAYATRNKVFYFSNGLKDKYILYNNKKTLKFFSKAFIAEFLGCEIEFVKELLETGNSYKGYFVDEILEVEN